jgi:hypothetical protein
MSDIRAMRCKRPSKRRWKARCRAGRHIPAHAIVDFNLERWFEFNPVNVNADIWQAAPWRATIG